MLEVSSRSSFAVKGMLLSVPYLTAPAIVPSVIHETEKLVSVMFVILICLGIISGLALRAHFVLLLITNTPTASPATKSSSPKIVGRRLILIISILEWRFRC